MSSDGGLEDFSLMDLFRFEVETHAEVLSSGLLALERSPGDASRFDEMMRAAHSIKGAARVVGVDPAVSVAHVMEDCFIAAQRGVLVLLPGDLDTLLRGVDLLGKISEATRDPNIELASAFAEIVKALVVELGAMLVPRSAQAVAGSVEASDPRNLKVAGTESGSSPTGPVETPPTATTIEFPEILDSAAGEAIRLQFLSAVQLGVEPIRIDLRATKDLDVQGLALLAAMPLHVARHGGPRLQVVGASSAMQIVLRVTGLREAYGIQAGSTPEEA